MTETHRPRVTAVVGPNGSLLTISDLPQPNTKRWVIRRKAEVVAAVRGGLLSLDEACSRYSLTIDEFLSWRRSVDVHGAAGLRTTRLKLYRGEPSEPSVFTEKELSDLNELIAGSLSRSDLNCWDIAFLETMQSQLSQRGQATFLGEDERKRLNQIFTKSPRSSALVMNRGGAGGSACSRQHPSALSEKNRRAAHHDKRLKPNASGVTA